MQLEFSTFAEFAKACAQADKVWASYGDAKTHRGFRDIENTIFGQPKAIGLISSVDEMDQVFALERGVSDRKDR